MDARVTYQELIPDRIVDTIAILSRRIDERFPNSGLANVCKKLLNIARQAQDQSTWIAEPIMSLRIGIWLLIAIIAGGIIGTLITLPMPLKEISFLQFIQVLEAGINDIVFIGVAIFFLITLERRIKRRRALKAIHELRAIAHIIDMHQLTKDPDRLLWRGQSTASSPQEELSAFLLSRYLNYCSEMLSLTGKIAILYVQKFDDPIALASVNEVEILTTGLSRKIWQKIMIISAGMGPREGTRTESLQIGGSLPPEEVLA